MTELSAVVRAALELLSADPDAQVLRLKVFGAPLLFSVPARCRKTRRGLFLAGTAFASARMALAVPGHDY
jgi:hypothetical protein